MNNDVERRRFIKDSWGKNAELLSENIIFILLNVAFFSILAVFVFIKSSDAHLLEEAYAKKIALVIDAARPGMEIEMDMKKANEVAKKKEYFGKIILIEGNEITVKLSEEGGYSYSFFNDVSLSQMWFDSKLGNSYSFKIEEKQ